MLTKVENSILDGAFSKDTAPRKPSKNIDSWRNSSKKKWVKEENGNPKELELNKHFFENQLLMSNFYFFSDPDVVVNLSPKTELSSSPAEEVLSTRCYFDIGNKLIIVPLITDYYERFKSFRRNHIYCFCSCLQRIP